MAESTVSEEEFSWSLAQALKDFSIESLKAEQVECIRRLICLREDVLAVLPTGNAVIEAVVSNVQNIFNVYDVIDHCNAPSLKTAYQGKEL